MLIPVKCFTCGKVIGDKYYRYKQLVIEQKQAAGIDPEKVQYLTSDNIEKSIEGNILDQFNIKNMCCRRHMLTHVDIF